MNGTLQRQTFIALRARREGYRIASEILNPPVPMPEAPARDPSDVREVDDWGAWTTTPHRPPVSKLKVALLIIVDAAIIAWGFWYVRS